MANEKRLDPQQRLILVEAHHEKAEEIREWLMSDNILYCLSCVDEHGPEIIKQLDPHIVKTSKFHKIQCSCGERYWKAVEWEFHTLERKHWAKAEEHFLSCGLCRKKLNRDHKKFRRLLRQELAETYENIYGAAGRSSISDIDADSSARKSYPNIEVDTDTKDKLTNFKGLPNIGEENEYAYEERGYVDKMMENRRKKRKYSVWADKGNRLTRALPGPQDGTFITQYLGTEHRLREREGEDEKDDENKSNWGENENYDQGDEHDDRDDLLNQALITLKNGFFVKKHSEQTQAS